MNKKKMHPIKKRRLLAGMTQQELSKKTGLTRSAITQYERSNCNPSFLAIIQISKSFKIAPKKLFSELIEFRYEQ